MTNKGPSVEYVMCSLCNNGAYADWHGSCAKRGGEEGTLGDLH